MKKLAMILVTVALSAGCASTPAKQETAPAAKQRKPVAERKPKAPKKQEESGLMQRMSASRRLSQALELLEQGNVPAATKLLRGICFGPPVAGVTDEALFRLGLLTLKPSPEHPVSRQGHHLLLRLKEEYPTSPWAVQAAPLLEMINIDEEFRRQNRTLKATNQTLNKKINELNQNIEQLKHLDLELEQKNR